MLKKALLVLLILIPCNNALAQFPHDFSDVIWVDPNISSWPVTATLNVAVTPSAVILNSSKSNVWPAGFNQILGNACCNANAWVFAKFGNFWYASTWEYLKFGQTAKNINSFEGAHTRRPPFFGGGFRWTPQNGEIYGLMVSGMARFNLNSVNVAERSEIAFYQWGVGQVDKSALGVPDPNAPPVVVDTMPMQPVLDLLLAEEPE